MRKLIILLFLSIFSTILYSQDNLSKFTFGLGYYGERISHPGFYVQSEFIPINENKQLSFPIRGGMGYYFHKRSHQALFLEIAPSVRYTFKNNLSVGFGGGIGIMSSWYESDLGVFSVDYQGNVMEESNYAGIDFMPSIHLALAYKILSTEKYNHYAWLRPATFLQLPENDGYVFHYSLAIGYSIRILN